MRLGVIARAEDRGLGIQTWEACRHLEPERILVVDVQNAEGFAMHLDRYPADRTTVVRLQPQGMNGWLPEVVCRDWLAGLDVVFSCETLYDWRLAEWARDAGCATVVQLNPEFWQHDRLDLPAPTAWWNPTTWRMEHLPPSTRHVPVPVALDRFTSGHGTKVHTDERAVLRALHVVGRPALGDRNGTELVHKAARRTSGVEWSIVSQQDTVHGQARHVADYWRLYDDHDVLVLPRRYGGLCLPAQEAMAAGLAVVMPAAPPNLDMWPIVPARWQYRGQLQVPAGLVPLVETDARDLAEVLNVLARDPVTLERARDRSRGWALEHSWAALLPLYRDELARAAERRTLSA